MADQSTKGILIDYYVSGVKPVYILSYLIYCFFHKIANERRLVATVSTSAFLFVTKLLSSPTFIVNSIFPPSIINT